MLSLSVNLNGNGALAGVRIHQEASAIEVILLEGGTASTAAKMIEAKYPDLFDD